MKREHGDDRALRAHGIGKSYGHTVALASVTLEIAAGEHVAIVGPSGAGKSSLVHLLAALDRPTEGAVYYGSTDYTSSSDEELAAIRRSHFGFVFQSGRLVPYLTAAENVAIPLLLQGAAAAHAARSSIRTLDKLGLGELGDRYPSQLSGGEQQRVAVARSLAHQPSVVFADEPTGNLDTENAERTVALLQNANKGRTLVVVTHDGSLLHSFDRVLEVRDGAIVGESATSAAR